VVWVVVVAVVALSLVGLALAILKAYRSGKALSREVARASQAAAPLSELQVGPAAGPAAPLTEAELRAREAALVAREAELERRLRTADT
jgi:hypothetical protein